MMSRYRHSISGFLLAGILTLLAWSSGCEYADDPKLTGPTQDIDSLIPDIPTYGMGTLKFDAASLGGRFQAEGPYKPSNVFLIDTGRSHGVGGFAIDTVLAGYPVQAQVVAYYRSDSARLTQRIVLIKLFNPSGALTTGSYPFALPGTFPASRHARLTYLEHSDSLGEITAYEGKFGSVTLTASNPTVNRLEGNFFCYVVAWPDTSRQYLLIDGYFKMYYTRHFFPFRTSPPLDFPEPDGFAAPAATRFRNSGLE